MITSYMCDSNTAEVLGDDAEMKRYYTRKPSRAFTSLLALCHLNLVKVKADECSAFVKGLIRNQEKSVSVS